MCVTTLQNRLLKDQLECTISRLVSKRCWIKLHRSKVSETQKDQDLYPLWQVESSIVVTGAIWKLKKVYQ